MARSVPACDFTVGWVCALPIELAAAIEMMDEEFADLPSHPADSNVYSFGRIGVHNVVAACLPAGQMGTNQAATVASQMKSGFPSLRFGVLVGIGGGVPNLDDDDDIRLGDVVISQPTGQHGGVIQYDFGKTGADGRIACTGSLNAPPTILLNALAKLRANDLRGKTQVLMHLSKLSNQLKFASPGPEQDTLYNASSLHIAGATCAKCRPEDVIDRNTREKTDPVLFFGNIASGNQVMKNGPTRDRYSRELGGILCFEMEAAGLMNNFSCIVIRGICDYADAHKNKRWQPYAAATAAACAKELLYTIPPLVSIIPDGIRKERLFHFIPLPQNKRFIERPETLHLQQKLLEDKCQSAALVGLGGVGKTQISLHIAYWAKENLPEYSVFWVPAYSLASFEQAYTDIAKEMGIGLTAKNEDIKSSVKQHLSSGKIGPWLLIVDNADDMEVLYGTKGDERSLIEHLPQNSHGKTLYTTRFRDVALSVSVDDLIEVHEMDEKEALSLLRNSLQRKDLIHDRCIELLGILTYLPLAITQAAAYLNRNKHVSIEKYLRLLQGTEQTLINTMSREFRDNTRYANSQNAVATTWLVSFNQIRRYSSYTADLLRFISRIEPKLIPQSILPKPGPEVDIEDALGTLCSYAFLSPREEAETFDMHSLVHLATRVWVRQQSLEDQTIREVIHQLDEVFPSDDHRNRALWRQYMPHTLKVLQESREVERDIKSSLYLQVGRCLRTDGRRREAVTSLEQSLALRKDCSIEDASRLHSQYELAWAYQEDGRVKEAIKLLEHVVEVQRTTLDEGHLDQLASQHTLAWAYKSDGRVKEAIKLLEYVVEVRKTLDEGHTDQLASQHTLAWAYKSDGRVKEAIKLLEHVVEVQRTTLDEGHPDQLSSQHTLAWAYKSDGRVKEAIKLLEHVVEVQRTTLDEGHPDRLSSQHELARVYKSDGRVKEAIKLLEHVVEVQRTTLDEGHPDQLSSQHTLAWAYKSDGRVKEAIKLLEYVVEVRKTLDEGHPDRLSSQYELAGAYQADGRVKEAIKLLEHVVEVQRTTLDEGHPDRLASQHTLAWVYQADGRVKEAIKLLEHVVEVQKTTLDEGHPYRLTSQYELAGAYQEDGRVKEAIKLLEHVIKVEETTLDEGHPDRLVLQHELARAYEADGRVKEAIELLEHVVGVQKTFDEGNPDWLASQHALAWAYREDGRVKEAIELLEHVVEVQKTRLDEGHPDQLASQHTLAWVYQADGRVKEAINLLEHVVEVQKTTLDEGHPDRLASQHALAVAYQADGRDSNSSKLQP
ncbi:hypothetical protein EsH8_IX_000551 [Colletotrichum jinshuiense]